MAIGYSTGGAANSGTAVASLAFTSFIATVGHVVVVAVAIGSTTSGVTSITDTKGNAYTQKVAFNGSGIRIELWASTTSVAGSGNVITVNLSPAVVVAGAWADYTGVASFGNSGTAAGSNWFAAARATVQENGNYMLAGIAFACQSGDTLTAFEGTSRQTSVPAATAAGVGLTDLASTITAAQIEVSDRISNSRNWAVAIVELRAAGAAAQPGNLYRGAAPNHKPPLAIAASGGAGGGNQGAVVANAGSTSYSFVS